MATPPAADWPSPAADADEATADVASPPLPSPPPPPPPRHQQQRPGITRPRGRRHHPYGADGLTRRQFALVQLALLVGSSVEWFDFSVYGSLSAVITPLFFPPGGDAATQALYFWGVFALSFATRPVGSLVLGSVGDRWGRRPALLASLVGMAVPTVLIGCLPTFSQAGIAAPVLLSVLRAVQGLAMGLEFSGAMVYSVELAPRRRRGLFGSVTFQGALLGIAAGQAAVMILDAALTQAQIAAFGWRLPFLATAVSALGAFALRMRMPEPRAWEACASGGVGEEGATAGGGGGGGGKGGSAAGAAANQASSGGVKGGGNSKGQGLPVSDRAAAAAAAAAELAAPAPSAAAAAAPSGKKQGARARPQPPRRHTQGVPVLKLLRRSWVQVVLQFLFEAFASVAFYVFALWLPSALQKGPVLMPARMAGGVTIAALAVMSAGSLLGGRASDACATPRRRLAAASAAVAVGSAVVVPGLLSMTATASAASAASAASGAGGAGAAYASAALLQAGMLCLAGFALGIIPSLCAELYKPDVRLVSFSLAHNLAMSLLGGTAPLVVSAAAGTAAGAAGAGPGVYVAAAGGASLLAALALGAWAPRLFVAAEARGEEGEGEGEGKGDRAAAAAPSGEAAV